MLKLSVFFLWLSLSTSSYSQYYPYETKPIKVSTGSFRSYVIPNARTIVKYYYNILVQIHDINKPLLKLKDLARLLVTSLKQFEESCPLMNEQCHKHLKEIYGMSRKIDQTILSIQGSSMAFDKRKASDNSSEHYNIQRKSHVFYLKLMGIIDHIGNTNYKLMHYLEEYRLTANTRYSTYFRKKNMITDLSYEILTSTKMALTTMIDKEMRSDFEAIWLQFIDRLEVNVIANRDKDFLVNRLEELNMSWNTYHMKMTKGNYKIPKPMVGTIKSMHQHWNSILKIVLR